MRVFTWTSLLRVALTLPVAGLVGVAATSFTAGTMSASAKLNCSAEDPMATAFCGGNHNPGGLASVAAGVGKRGGGSSGSGGASSGASGTSGQSSGSSGESSSGAGTSSGSSGTSSGSSGSSGVGGGHSPGR